MSWGGGCNKFLLQQTVAVENPQKMTFAATSLPILTIISRQHFLLLRHQKMPFAITLQADLKTKRF